MEPNPQMNIVVHGFDGASWTHEMLKAGLTYPFIVGVAHCDVPDEEVRKAVRVLMTDTFGFHNVTTEIVPAYTSYTSAAYSAVGSIILTKTWFGSTYAITNMTKPISKAKMTYIKVNVKV